MSNFKRKIGSALSSESAFSAATTAVILGIAIVLNVLVYALGVIFELYLYSPAVDDLTLSGYSDNLFKEAIEIENIYLPKSFYYILVK